MYFVGILANESLRFCEPLWPADQVGPADRGRGGPHPVLATRGHLGRALCRERLASWVSFSLRDSELQNHLQSGNEVALFMNRLVGAIFPSLMASHNPVSYFTAL
jgi:hypothetical protein